MNPIGSLCRRRRRVSLLLLALHLSTLIPQFSSAFELKDPRARSTSSAMVVDPSSGTSVPKDRWSVVDMHWLETEISIDKGHLSIYPNLIYSTEEWEINEQICPEPSKRCVAIPYAVDRQFKNAYLSEDILFTYPESVLRSSINDLCEAEQLTESNCLHLFERLMDAIEQQKQVPNSTMTVRLNSDVISQHQYPFPKEIRVALDQFDTGLISVRVEVDNFFGYSPGKFVNSSTVAEVSFFHNRNKSCAPGAHVTVRSPINGGRYRSTIPIDIEGGDEICVVVNNTISLGCIQDSSKIRNLSPGQTTLAFYDRENCLLSSFKVDVVDDAFTVRDREKNSEAASINFSYNSVTVSGVPLKRNNVLEAGALIKAQVPGIEEIDIQVSESAHLDFVDYIFSITEFAPSKLFPSDMVFVTACSQQYFDDGRLQNLVGSIHFWEKGVGSIVFYDLGLTEESLSEIKSWKNVVVRPIPDRVELSNDEIIGTPDHVKDAAKYAFKPIVIWDALRRTGTNGAVFWIDAGTEIRKPLHEFREQLYTNGHFLIEHPYGFPNHQFHHPDCLKGLGCLGVEEASMQHCATTFVAVVNNVEGEFFEVLREMVRCSLTETCINPIGATRANHRQEQTVMNSIFCRKGLKYMCTNDERMIQSTNFENDKQKGVEYPTSDETTFNDIVLYTRRVHPVKPYVRYLLRN